MYRVAFIDNQLLALDFHSGDAVQRGGLHDFFLTPYVGRVLYSNPATGRVTVQWPWGAEQESPAELVKLNNELIQYFPPSIDQSYSSLDQAKNTDDKDTLKSDAKWRKSLASRAVVRFEEEAKPVWREACRLWHQNTDEIEAFQRLSSKFGDRFSHDVVRLTISNLYNMGKRFAIYWRDKNRQYRVTKKEK